LEIHIVVKAIFYGWTDGQQSVGVEVKDGLRKQMRTGVPEGLLAFIAIPGVKNQVAIARKGIVNLNGFNVAVKICLASPEEMDKATSWAEDPFSV
jgi:hypothetical protein